MSNLNSSTDVSVDQRSRAGSPLEVLRIFLKLGLTCFGGPIAHIGYFRDEFVVRRKWIDEHAFWDAFRKRTSAQAMMRGDAAVVGLLGVALYNPVWTTTVHSPRDFGIALVGFVLLTVWRAPPLVVAFSAAAGTAMALV